MPDTMPSPIDTTHVATEPGRGEQSSHNLTDIHKIKIMYTNVRGLKGKISSVIEQLSSEKPHFFLLTETLLTTNTDLNIQGYTFFGKARNERSGGE